MVYRLKDWPSGEEFMALMPSRFTYTSLHARLYNPKYFDHLLKMLMNCSSTGEMCRYIK